MLLFQSVDHFSFAQEHNLLGILKMHGIQVLGDIWVVGSVWCSSATFWVSSRPCRHGDDLGLCWLLGLINGLAELVDNLPLQESNS